MSEAAQSHDSKPDIQNRLIVLYGVVFTIVVAVLVIWLRDYFFVVRNEAIERNVLQTSNPKLAELRAHETEILGSYGWVDKEKGVVRIPIDRAMELEAQEAAGRDGGDSPQGGTR